jgi:hypothetical protein
MADLTAGRSRNQLLGLFGWIPDPHTASSTLHQGPASRCHRGMSDHFYEATLRRIRVGSIFTIVRAEFVREYPDRTELLDSRWAFLPRLLRYLAPQVGRYPHSSVISASSVLAARLTRWACRSQVPDPRWIRRGKGHGEMTRLGAVSKGRLNDLTMVREARLKEVTVGPLGPPGMVTT